MEIIKEAFVEGRDTDTEWDKSKAKKNEIKLEIALENYSTLGSREKRSLMPLHKICPTTGKVLERFPSRLAACRHIVKDILKRPDKNPLSISGNLEIGMRGGWKSYGFYWKIADVAEGAKERKVKAEKGAMPVYYCTGSKETVFNTQYDAAAHFGICRKKLRAILNGDTTKNRDFLNGAILQKFNPTPRVLNFKSIQEASDYTQCSPNIMRKAIEAGGVINNVTYKIVKGINSTLVKETKAKVSRDFIATGYDLFKNGKKIGTYDTIKDLAAQNKLSRQSINKKIVRGEPLTKDGSLTVKPRYVLARLATKA